MPKRLIKQEMADFYISIGMPQDEAASHAEYADNTYQDTDLIVPPITHAYGKKGYEIHVRSGVYYAAFSEYDKKDQVIKDREIILFSSKSKKLQFPYKFTVKGKDKEFTEQEYRDIEVILHNPVKKANKPPKFS